MDSAQASECREKSSIWLYLGEQDIFYPFPLSFEEVRYLLKSKEGVKQLILEIAQFASTQGTPFDPSSGLKWVVYIKIREDSVEILRGFYEFARQRESGAADFVLLVLDKPLCLSSDTLRKLARYVKIAHDIEPLCVRQNFHF
ncbi:MAG: hypothetical protein LM590_04095 [Thermofilum sp.]|jgi:hypothetical protein|nr:hypothetical protein [Thermofilum sp.]